MNLSSRVPPIEYTTLKTAVHLGGSRLRRSFRVHTEEGLKHAFTTLYKVKSRSFFFFCCCCCYWQRVSAASGKDPEATGRGAQGRGGGSLGSWACTEVSICFPALMGKVPSSLLDRQLKGKRKLGVRQEFDSTHISVNSCFIWTNVSVRLSLSLSLSTRPPPHPPAMLLVAINE